jgi:hypothetical protein
VKGIVKWIALVGLAAVASPAFAQTDAGLTQYLDVILEQSKAEDVLGGQAQAMVEQLQAAGTDVDPDALASTLALVREEFALDRLRRDLVAFMADAADADLVAELTRWLDAGANAEIRRVEESFQPPETLEEFARGLQDSAPPQARIQLVARWAATQGAGDFYIILEEAAREAVHGILAKLELGLGDFAPLTRQSYSEQHDRSLQFAIVSFLHRFREVPDGVIERAIGEYESESGQWYIEAYTIGIAEAILNAGARVVARVEDR